MCLEAHALAGGTPRKVKKSSVETARKGSFPQSQEILCNMKTFNFSRGNQWIYIYICVCVFFQEKSQLGKGTSDMIRKN